MKKYISAEMQIVKISANDIIATSMDVDPDDTNDQNTAPSRSIWDDNYSGNY